jgi:hypothetical protein
VKGGLLANHHTYSEKKLKGAGKRIKGIGSRKSSNSEYSSLLNEEPS